MTITGYYLEPRGPLLPAERIVLPSGAGLSFVEWLDENGSWRHKYDDALGEFQGISKTMEKAQVGFPDKEESEYMRLGARRHRAIYYYNIGEIDMATVDRQDLGHLDSWVAAVQKYGIEIIGAEVLVAIESRRIATRIDVVGRCELTAGELFTANVKGGNSYPSYGIQTAIEGLLFAETYKSAPWMERPAAHRLCFYTHGDGKPASPKIMNDAREWAMAEWVLDNGGARSA